MLKAFCNYLVKTIPELQDGKSVCLAEIPRYGAAFKPKEINQGGTVHASAPFNAICRIVGVFFYAYFYTQNIERKLLQ